MLSSLSWFSLWTYFSCY